MILIGDSSEVSFVVKESDTAHALAISTEDSFPEVFATSRMVAIMELAASRLMNRILQPGEMSVGVIVNIRHIAATPIGSRVRAVATYLGPEGRLYKFKVEAFDDAGPIGDGEHSRAIITTERLLAGAVKRKNS
jgi:predicted thioesterase